MVAAEYSTIGPIGTIIAQAMEGAGLDAAAMFSAAGLDLEALHDPNVRMPSEALQHVLVEASERCDDPVFGLRLAGYVHPTTFYSLGMAMYFSRTLGEYLERLIKYYRMITTNDALHTVIEEDTCCLEIRPREGMPLIPIRVDGAAAVIVSTIRVAVGEGLNLKFVRLGRPRPEGRERDYERFFGCPVTYDEPFTVLGLDRADLDSRLPTANPELAGVYERLTEDYLGKIDRADGPSRWRNELVRLLPTGVSGKDQVAQALNMSTRTLYNKLESAGTTYREVLDCTRRELAEDYIRRDLPIYEIAYLIGFSDTANFSRAFKKWTGHSPIEFRETVAGTVA
jgi:hypothetical protein